MGHVRAAAAELNRAAAEARPAAAPVVVQAPPPPNALQRWLSDQSAKALDVVIEIGIAGLLAYFLLAAGDTFRRKLVHVAGPTLAARRITVEILDEIDAQVQRYLMTMLVINTLIGLATWGILLAFGVEHAALWGVVAAVAAHRPVCRLGRDDRRHRRGRVRAVRGNRPGAARRAGGRRRRYARSAWASARGCRDARSA